MTTHAGDCPVESRLPMPRLCLGVLILAFAAFEALSHAHPESAFANLAVTTAGESVPRFVRPGWPSV